jgi:hypothetical protein
VPPDGKLGARIRKPTIGAESPIFKHGRRRTQPDFPANGFSPAAIRSRSFDELRDHAFLDVGSVPGIHL